MILMEQKAEEMLTEKIIPFWKSIQDKENGGYCGFVDFDLNKDIYAEKGCILNSRILWFFASAAQMLKREDLAEHAEHAYRYLMDACLDREYGGVYWSTQYNGIPKDTTKHTYNQGFAIYALSAYYKLTKNQEALETAKKIFHLIEEKCTDEVGYQEAFTREWNPESNEKLSENGIMAEKTMNTLLHVFEGYSGLYEACPDEEVAAAMRRIIHIYMEKVFDPVNSRQNVFFDAMYHSLIDLHSYGHDIESSWLIEWGCALLKDEALLECVKQIDDYMVKATYEAAYHKNSLYNECDRGKTDKTRVWWVQTEAVLGFLNAWEKHPEQIEYIEAAVNTLHYIDENLVDKRVGGEWFWEVDDEGKPSSRKPIVEPWKCPYHNGRMCMEIMRRKNNVQY